MSVRALSRTFTAAALTTVLLGSASLTAAGLLSTAAASPSVTKPTAALGVTGRVVSYAGLSVTVPASWPVIDLRRRPDTCVRFDRHAVYLGAPGAAQNCPAHLVGRTESVLLGPATATATPDSPMASTTAGLVPAAAVSAAGRQIGIAAAGTGAQLTVTWGADEGLATRIAASATRRFSVPSTFSAGDAVPQYPVGASSTRLGGKAFDTCAAPSTRTMAAWKRSPYRGVAVYIGGPNRACADGNLSAAWVSTVANHQHWRVLPIYVGRQAICDGPRFARISADLATAYAQGLADAADAVASAAAFGLQPGSAIYDDMEGYAGSAGCTRGVLTFVSGFTSGLHGAGYLSGVYSSGSSGIYDLGRNFYDSAYLMPDLIWTARWDGVVSTRERNLTSLQWSNHQRAKQYAGDHYERWGGVRIDIDSDYVDSALATVGYPVTVAVATQARPAPLIGTASSRALPAQTRVTASCWVVGARVGSSTTWLELTDGSFVPRTDMNLGGQAPPRCGLVYTTWTTLSARSGPGANYPTRQRIPGGTAAWVVCQRAGLKVRTSVIWDRLQNGTWVSDYFMNTPGHSTWSPNLPRC